MLCDAPLPHPQTPRASERAAHTALLLHASAFKLFSLSPSRCGEMADAQDLKSWDRKKSCRFESDHRHQTLLRVQQEIRNLQVFVDTEKR